MSKIADEMERVEENSVMKVKVMNTVSTTSVGGFGMSVSIGVWWYVWGIYGFWWGVCYGFFWPVWLGFRLAAYALAGIPVQP